MLEGSVADADIDTVRIGPAAKTGQKRKLGDDANGEDGTPSTAASPAKKASVTKKGTAQIKKKTKYQTDDEGDDEDTPNPSKKRSPRKSVRVETGIFDVEVEEAIASEEHDFTGSTGYFD